MRLSNQACRRLGLLLVGASVYCLSAINAMAQVTRPTAPPAAQGARPPATRPAATPQPIGRPPVTVKRAPAAPSRAPFQLTAEQHSYLLNVLAAWEQSTSTINTFKSTFTRWNYDMRDREMSKSEGQLSYKSPDKGTYRIDKISEKDAQGNYIEIKDSVREHWATDGQVILDYDYRQSIVTELPIPPDMQGRTIQDSPIPFVFGAKPHDLQKRYWLRVITPAQFVQQEIWLEAHPRYQADAANFTKSIMRFDRTNFQPIALRRYLPTGEYDSFKFENVSVNPLLPNWKELFSPKIPRGWKLVRKTPPGAAPAPVTAGRQQPAQR